jgi:hypothetical protein
MVAPVLEATTSACGGHQHAAFGSKHAAFGSKARWALPDGARRQTQATQTMRRRPKAQRAPLQDCAHLQGHTACQSVLQGVCDAVGQNLLQSQRVHLDRRRHAVGHGLRTCETKGGFVTHGTKRRQPSAPPGFSQRGPHDGVPGAWLQQAKGHCAAASACGQRVLVWPLHARKPLGRNKKKPQAHLDKANTGCSHGTIALHELTQ